MNSPIAEAQSILTLDIGTIHTRALLFDVVDDQYRFLGSSMAPSTYGAPFYDISEGVYQALHRLEESTGRVLLSESILIQPSQADGSGVDELVITYTAGPSLKMAVLGLLEEVSLESARRLASSAQTILVEAIGLNDSRKMDQQIDALLQAQPDLILIAGGTEQGATRSVEKITELVAAVMQLTPIDRMPDVIFAGNQAMQKHVTEALSKFNEVQVAPNIRPSVDQEVLAPAQDLMVKTITDIRNRQLGGLQSYGSIASVMPVPSSYATGRLVRFLSQVNTPGKDVLTIDLGASNTTVASGRDGQLDLSVYAVGMGAGLSLALQLSSLNAITRWLPMAVPDDVVRDYLRQKTLFPGAIPATVETLAIEQAMARQILYLAMRTHRARYQTSLTSFDPVLAAGATLTDAPPGEALLMLLDSLQPTETSTFMLDPYGLVAALGSAAAINTIMPVQVIESNAFVNLGTVISPISRARTGTPILRVHVELTSGEENSYEIQKGTIQRLPVPLGQTATVKLEPLLNLDLDESRKDRKNSYKITGGILGLVIDARGRPIVLPGDASRRQETLEKWSESLGG